jgi:hypothetical protein
MSRRVEGEGVHRPSLQQHLDDVWQDHAVAGRNNVTVLASSPGRWHERPVMQATSCASPSLLLFLGGHYRTFAWTQYFFRQFAAQSANGCALAVAFMPDVVDASREIATPGAWGRVNEKALNRFAK